MTELRNRPKNRRQSRHTARGSALLRAVVVAAAVAATYGAFLGWDQHKDTDPATGAQSGPYQPWQVIGCAAVLALVAFAAGRRGRTWLVVPVLPIVLTVCFSVDAATDTDSDGLWPIGAAFVALGSLFGTAAVAALGAGLAAPRQAR
jgi:peptidoglycan/LPS O-acetylase OafA/YrhL